MSIIGRRGSGGSGWTWTRPPPGARRPPPTRRLLLLLGAGVLALLIALAALLSESGEGSPTDGTPTPTTPTAVLSTGPTPTPTLTATPTEIPSPTATPHVDAPLFRLSVWDGSAWRSSPPQGATFQAGEAVPFMLRIDQARPGDTYFVTFRYDCGPFAFLTSYSRDSGSEPALAPDGPQRSATADTTLRIPDDPGIAADDGEGGSLSLWGGSFQGLTPILPVSACVGDKSFTVGLAAADETVHLLWGALLSETALDGDSPFRLTLLIPGGEELRIEIDPASVSPSAP